MFLVTLCFSSANLRDFVIKGNEVCKWYSIPSTEWVAGMPPAILVPVALPEIQEVKATESEVCFSFVLSTKEEEHAWAHTKRYMCELFGDEIQKDDGFFGALSDEESLYLSLIPRSWEDHCWELEDMNPCLSSYQGRLVCVEMDLESGFCPALPLEEYPWEQHQWEVEESDLPCCFI